MKHHQPVIGDYNQLCVNLHHLQTGNFTLRQYRIGAIGQETSALINQYYR